MRSGCLSFIPSEKVNAIAIPTHIPIVQLIAERTYQAISFHTNWICVVLHLNQISVFQKDGFTDLVSTIVLRGYGLKTDNDQLVFTGIGSVFSRVFFFEAFRLRRLHQYIRRPKTKGWKKGKNLRFLWKREERE
jgi:hypothetical protein